MWLILLALVIIALTLLVQRQYSHWDRRNVPHLQASVPMGSLDPVRRGERSFGLVMHDIYMGSKEKLIGIYLLFRPALLVRDAELVRQIMTTDFGSFHDRGVYVDEVHDPFSANLFNLRGQSWKILRAKLTPSFTSGKLKGMFGTINDVGDKLVQHLNKQLGQEASKMLEIQSILRTYAIDVIGSVIFGLDIDSFSNPDNEFRTVSNRLLEPTGFLRKINGLCSFLCPPIVTIMKRLGYNDPVMFTLRDIVKRTIDFREQNKVVRKDLLQLLIQLRNTGKISDDDDQLWDVETVAETLKSLSIDKIASQAFLFYIAGSETTAATAAFSLYELSMYPDLLKKAQEEIMDCLQKHDLKPTDKFTYDAVQDMKFLDLCVMETTRMYPGLPILNRECTQNYTVPGTNYTIEKGTPIIISLLGMHRDPEYFPDPLRYDPERFLDENHNYSAVAYMPFGEGPRHCIAQRMGQINSKLALAKILSNFNVETREHKEVEFRFDSAPILTPKEGLHVRLSKKEL